VKDLNKAKETIQKIKIRGYWEVEIRPLKYDKEKLSLDALKEIVEKSQTKLRGWRYPTTSTRTGGYYSGDNYLESWVDWQEIKEVWRFYQSGQFYQFKVLQEDWFDEAKSLLGGPEPLGQRYKPKQVLEIILTLYTLTEIFLFASNLASQKVFDEHCHITIKLHNTAQRRLTIFESLRHLDFEYISQANSLTAYDKDVTVPKLLADNSKIAMDATLDLFKKFNWFSTEIRKVLDKDQEKLLKGFF